MFKRKRNIYAFLAIAIVAAALVLARSYFLKKFQDTVLDEIQALNESEIKIHYDTIYLDWKRNILTIEKLVIEKDVYDTTCVYPEFISCQKAEIKGVGLISLLFQSELNIDQLKLLNPHWVLHQNSELLKQDSTRSSRKSDFTMYIEDIIIDSMEMELTDSTTCRLLTGIKTSAAIRNFSLALKKQGGKPEFLFSDFTTRNTRIDLPRAFYTFLINDTKLSMAEHTFRLDTMRIVPSFNKLQFGREAKTDVDRIEGVIPFLKISQLNLQYLDTVMMDAAEAEVQMFLKLFHDKRLPHKNRVVPLPLDQLKSLKFGLMIDKLQIHKSYVEYEEVPAQADVAGKVFFDNIEGKMTSITNDFSDQEGKTILVAKADFMGQGNLSVKAVFPWNEKRKGTVKGSVTGLSFEKLNDMVEPQANMKFESGRLNELDFAFSFSDRYSNGNVSINYENLKLIALRTDEQIEKVGKKKRNRNKSEEDLRTDNLKTFIVNAFVVKKNMDETMPADKRMGTISYERDRSRSVFNFWWKSIFTGLKSAFNLDKAEATVEKLKSRKKK